MLHVEARHVERPFSSAMRMSYPLWSWDYQYLGQPRRSFHLKVPGRRPSSVNKNNFGCLFAHLCCLFNGDAVRFIPITQDWLKASTFVGNVNIRSLCLTSSVPNKLRFILLFLQLSWRYWNGNRLLLASACSLVVLPHNSTNLCWRHSEQLQHSGYRLRWNGHIDNKSNKWESPN